MSKNSGNVLVFILMAVFLLGGLTAIFVRSSGTSEETGSTERARINATQIIRESVSVEAAVQKLLLNNCANSMLNFFYKDPASANTSSPADKSCNVYDAKGGGMEPRMSSNFSPFFKVADFEDIGTTATDIVQVIAYEASGTDASSGSPSGLSRETCKQINSILGNGIGLPEVGGDFLTGRFTGNFSVAAQIGYDDPAQTLAGVESACAVDATGAYVFYNVIVKQ